MKQIFKNKKLILTILTLAIPAIIEMALNTLVGVIDTIMVSQFIGVNALDAAGFAAQIINTIIMIFTSFNVGASTIIARSFGEKNFDKLNRVVGQNLLLNTLIGIIIMLVSLIFAPAMFSIFDITSNIRDMGVAFYRIIATGMVFIFMSNAIKATLRGASNTRTPMQITLFINILNIFGNYVLITGFWIFPRLGFLGSAVSTTICRLIEVVIFMYILLQGKNGVQLRWANLRLTREVFAPLWRLSSVAGLEQTMMQFSFLASSMILSKLDTLAEGSFRILLSIESMSFMPAVGFSIAAASLIGKNMGEKKNEEALHTGYTAGVIGILWGLLMCAIFFTFPRSILSIFTQDQAVIKASFWTMFAMGINQAPLAFGIIMSGALRGTGDTLGVMIFAALRLWAIFVPLCWVFMITLGYGIIGMWYAETLSFFLYNYIIFKRFKKMEWTKISVGEEIV